MLQTTLGDSEVLMSFVSPTSAIPSKQLYPRLALFEALATFQNEHGRRTQSGDDIVETRRAFLDSFAYICDIRKGGATVTAAGLQKLPYSNILWLAANEGIHNDVKSYAETILNKLLAVTLATQQIDQDEIFHLVVDKCTSRLAMYNDEMQKFARNCRMQLRKEEKDEAGAIFDSCHSREKSANLSSGSAS